MRPKQPLASYPGRTVAYVTFEPSKEMDDVVCNDVVGEGDGGEVCEGSEEGDDGGGEGGGDGEVCVESGDHVEGYELEGSVVYVGSDVGGEEVGGEEVGGEEVVDVDGEEVVDVDGVDGDEVESEDGNDGSGWEKVGAGGKGALAGALRWVVYEVGWSDERECVELMLILALVGMQLSVLK